MSADPLAPIDLRTLGLVAGGAVELPVPAEGVVLRLGGQDYVLEAPAPAQLTVTRALSGLSLSLRAGGDLVGPCWRCLEIARTPVRIVADEYHADPQPGESADSELSSVYVDEEHIDAALWLRDAVAESVPPMILCRADCAGLCAQCGADLNSGPCNCTTERVDERWGPLRDIARRLEADAEG